MLIAGPGAPEALRAPLLALQEALDRLNQPGAPTPIFATTQAGLPPAVAHPRTLLLVSDLNILAHSDGTNWIRQDTGAVIV